MSKVLINKILIIAISLTCLLILVIPYSMFFDPGEGSSTWQRAYIWNDFVLAIIYLPFIILWSIFLLLKKSMLKNILQFVLICLVVLYFFLALMSFVFIAQDTIPYIGVFLTLLLCPLLFWHLINARQMKSNK